MKLALRYFTVTLLMYAVLLTTACPSSASLEKAKSESSRLATYANAGVDLTRSLYESKVITIQQKDAVAQKFVVLAQGGVAFDAAVQKALATYGTDVPKTEIDRIFATFDAEVISKFLDILQSLKLIANADRYAQVIDTLRTAVLVVAKVFNHGASVAARLSAAT